MENELQKRKPTRLRDYDYSSAGAYFLTICTKDRRNILSSISVGDGAHDVPITKLTEIGKIAEKYILSTKKIEKVSVDRFVIMPNHIHMIVFVSSGSMCNGTSRAPSPTNEMIPHIVSTFKRLCNREIGEDIFQRSYYDHIIRDKEDYETRCRYIYENPARWYYDELYSTKS